MHFLSTQDRIYVAGHGGLAGSAVVRHLRRNGYGNILYRTEEELDLRIESDVRDFFESKRPHHVILAGSNQGGAVAGDRNPEQVIDEKLAVHSNVIQAAQSAGVKRLIFLSSSSIYPNYAPEPLREDVLLSGSIDVTTHGAAVGQTAGVLLCRAFRAEYGSDFVSLLATSLYGPGDRFDHEDAPLIPTLLRQLVDARSPANHADLPVSISGTGTSRRDFLYVDDLAAACVFVLRLPTSILDASVPDGLLNVGSGRAVSTLELAHTIRKTVGSESELVLDATTSDNTEDKQVDVSRMTNLGWTARTDLKEGLRRTLAWYLRTRQTGRRDASSTHAPESREAWASQNFAHR